MEEILGVKEDTESRRSLTRGADQLGEDTTLADLQVESEGSNAARDRYQRMFWEPVVEGKASIALLRYPPHSNTNSYLFLGCCCC